MALEIIGARLLSPAFGSSVDVWAAVISVFILSLSVGYVLGGRLADHVTTNAALGVTIAVAGMFYCVLPVYAWPLTGALESLHDKRYGSLVAGLLLFLPPSLMLGMVSPMLVKLVFTRAESVGRTTGTLYAIGSVGNVLGVLVADYFLLVLFKDNSNLIGMGAILIVVGLAHLFIKVRNNTAVAQL